MPAPTTPGKIFLADQRGLVETSEFRRYCTFSFGLFQHAHKQPLGALLALNEELLAGGATVALPVAEAAHVLLLPITGVVEVLLPSGDPLPVETEQLQVLTLPAGSALRLQNPFPHDIIRILHVWLRAAEASAVAIGPLAAFSAGTLANRLALLLPASPTLPVTVSLGRFAGRHEVEYVVPPGRLFFAFVLAGAFEAEGRLLHESDGLALWDAPAPVELEALSNDALLLVLAVAH
ncbi:hypothetical protein GKZ68_05535 [Hymenobacter sp. BRD128]|uniref:pirin family protein n=1 Tax=Hymenobacter sp. BRD128 TaxID=2675878 RepID=UPI0015675BCB|nr:hypothetical protein [Hymenobacter sp. BRD128]QKG56152.1 hypothetical protein GKZ68_05535 [Hymenobacter sp. BRD128]